MANQVFANGMEVACKAAAGQSAAAFPDTCLSPPTPPAGPVPIPYPNTAFAKDTDKGSTTVMISGDPVMLKDQSVFKTSAGNEAATKSQGMGVVTHTIQGEASFSAWSMDVKFEGANADRHMDMMVHNEQSLPANTPPWIYLDSMAAGSGGNAGDCKDMADDIEDNCSDYKSDSSGACCKAKKCLLTPYGRTPECCDDKTKHHVVPDHCFKSPGEQGAYYQGIKDLSYGTGLGLCVSGDDKNEKRKQHARIHRIFDAVEAAHNPVWTFKEARAEGVKACASVTHCDPKCMDQQIKTYYGERGLNDASKLRADPGGNFDPPPPATMGTLAAPGSTGALGAGVAP